MNEKTEEKTEVKEEKEERKAVPPPLRQILIETDGNDIKLTKAEVGGRIELIGILQNVISYLNQQK